jgi:3-oxoacyl-[acyl-carrier protein] reductase
MRRTAVVTGGAGGIGGAIVRALSDAGHDVAILDRQGEFAVDLPDEAAVREIAGRLGPRDVVVHAAAAFDRASLAALDGATWRRVQAVNVESALWLCQALTPAMIERGFGRVFITSNTEWRPPADDFLPYVASKATLIGVARTLAKPLGAHGITVNCVAPGLPGRRSPRRICRSRRSRRCPPARPSHAPWFRTTLPDSWRFWPATPPRRSPVRRCAPTADRSCAEVRRTPYGIGWLPRLTIVTDPRLGSPF